MDITQDTLQKYQRGVDLAMAAAKTVYDSAVKVGFSPEQALMLATAYMTNTFTEARNEVKE